MKEKKLHVQQLVFFCSNLNINISLAACWLATQEVPLLAIYLSDRKHESRAVKSRLNNIRLRSCFSGDGAAIGFVTRRNARPDQPNVLTTCNTWKDATLSLAEISLLLRETDASQQRVESPKTKPRKQNPLRPVVSWKLDDKRLSSRAFSPEYIVSARISSKEVGRPEAASRPFCRRRSDALPLGVPLKQTPRYNAISLGRALSRWYLERRFRELLLWAKLSSPHSTGYKLTIFGEKMSLSSCIWRYQFVSCFVFTHR